MSLTKVNYIDNSTIITAQNLNDIQDNIIQNSELVKKAAPRNLLDNSDFRNPINQRGYVSGTAINTYVIDRWRASSGNFNLTTDGIGITAGQMNQLIDLSLFKDGKIYTIACKIDGNILCYSGVKGSTIGSWENGLVATVNPEYGVYIIYLTKVGSKYEWAAFYEGEYTAETLPEYQPKGYGAELRECQRYYYQSWDSSAWDGKTIKENPIYGFIAREAFATSRLQGVELPATMRVTPTIEFYSTRGVADAVSEYSDGTIYVSRIDPVYWNSKQFLPASANSEFVVGKQYAFHYSANADL